MEKDEKVLVIGVRFSAKWASKIKEQSAIRGISPTTLVRNLVKNQLRAKPKKIKLIELNKDIEQSTLEAGLQ